MSDVPCFVGIDVAKAQLDIALRPTGERWAVPNDASGVTTLVDRLGPPPHPDCAGSHRWPGARGDERLGHGGPPRRRRQPAAGPGFCPSYGQLAKTDALDARALAHFADVIRPTPRPLPDAQTQELRALLGRRQQLVVMRTAEHNRLAGTARASRRTLRPILRGSMRASPRWTTTSSDAPGQPAVAGKRRSVAECQGYWARVCPHVAAGTPRVGDAHAAADRGLGRRGAAEL